MARDRSRRGAGSGSGASPAELDALSTVIAATAAMADRARREAAGDLLRRALALILERSGTLAEVAERGGRDGERDGFRSP